METRYIIRRTRLVHCARGPQACDKCREIDREAICLLDIAPPDAGLVARRVLPLAMGGVTVWREFDIARIFADEAEARDYAAGHGIEDVEL